MHGDREIVHDLDVQHGLHVLVLPAAWCGSQQISHAVRVYDKLRRGLRPVLPDSCNDDHGAPGLGRQQTGDQRVVICCTAKRVGWYRPTLAWMLSVLDSHPIPKL